MRSISTFFRWMVVSVWGLFLIPVLVDFLKKWLERNGAYEHAGEWTIDAVAGVARLPGVYPALFVLSGLVVGVWFDAVLRRFDGSRNAKLVKLGFDLRNLGGRVRDRQNGFHSSWPNNIDELKPELLSCHLRLTKVGIWSPGLSFHSRSEGANWLANYLETIGTLLMEHHFAEARENALGVKQALEAQTG
jgi:hypothetical protein